MFIAQVCHYENLTALHKLISIVLQLTSQIKQNFPAQSCGVRANFLKLLWGQGCKIDETVNFRNFWKFFTNICGILAAHFQTGKTKQSGRAHGSDWWKIPHCKMRNTEFAFYQVHLNYAKYNLCSFIFSVQKLNPRKCRSSRSKVFSKKHFQSRSLKIFYKGRSSAKIPKIYR